MAGYLGQSRAHKPDAIGISQATEDVIKRFTRRYCSPPAGAAVTPVEDPDLFNHILKLVEAITIDSAYNEVLSVQDVQQGGRGPSPFPVMHLPRCRFLLRDGAHKARRILSRPWSACAILGDLVGLTCHWKDSMGQLIHHSTELKKLYAQCVEECDHESAVSTRFANMRCAKHRLETHITPLSRAVLNFSAYILFAVKLAVLRKGEREGRAAEVFLTALKERGASMLLLLAMMADAGNEALHLIRYMDKEDFETADLCTHVEGFLDSIAWMFHRAGVFVIPGHCAYALEWLTKPHFFTVQGLGARIGGGAVPEDLKLWALDLMRSWTVLA